MGTDFEGLSIISCRECRRRKVKCNRIFPRCQNCIKKNYECVYPPTFRKTSTKLTKKRKGGNTRFYGFSSVNRSLFEVGMPFCNVDFELESKNATSQIKRFTSSEVFKGYIKNPEPALAAIGLIRESISSSFFSEILDYNALELALCSRQGFDYQTLLLSYAVIIVSERFTNGRSDLEILVRELNMLLEECPDCPEKVSSLLLLADYYHYNFKIETAWKCTFLATSIAYALGLHAASSKVWAMLVLNDALLCSVLGRPTSIKCVNPKILCRLCDGWGEVAFLLRECNEILLNLKSLDSIEKIISLDMKYDDFIERTKKAMKSSEDKVDSEKMLLGYLKICIMTATRVKLLFPVFPKHRAFKTQLDENCNSLTLCLQGLFEFLKSSGLASEQKPFAIRSQFFPAYCSMFQGFLLQFLFTSNEIQTNSNELQAISDEATDNLTYASLLRHLSRGNFLLSSLDNTVTLIKDYEGISKCIEFCSFMKDVFDSFRALLNRRIRETDGKALAPGKEGAAVSQNDQKVFEDNMLLTGTANESRIGENNTLFMTEDIADWITSCFYDGIPYFYPSENSS